jgi:hypothetical protein
VPHPSHSDGWDVSAQPVDYTLPQSVSMPPEPTPATPKQAERRAQIRGLLYLALAAIAFSILRAILHSGLHAVFNRGWWRLW